MSKFKIADARKVSSEPHMGIKTNPVRTMPVTAPKVFMAPNRPITLPAFSVLLVNICEMTGNNIPISKVGSSIVTDARTSSPKNIVITDPLLTL